MSQKRILREFHHLCYAHFKETNKRTYPNLEKNYFLDVQT